MKNVGYIGLGAVIISGSLLYWYNQKKQSKAISLVQQQQEVKNAQDLLKEQFQSEVNIQSDIKAQQLNKDSIDQQTAKDLLVQYNSLWQLYKQKIPTSATSNYAPAVAIKNELKDIETKINNLGYNVQSGGIFSQSTMYKR